MGAKRARESGLLASCTVGRELPLSPRSASGALPTTKDNLTYLLNEGTSEFIDGFNEARPRLPAALGWADVVNVWHQYGRRCCATDCHGLVGRLSVRHGRYCSYGVRAVPVDQSVCRCVA